MKNLRSGFLAGSLPVLLLLTLTAEPASCGEPAAQAAIADSAATSNVVTQLNNGFKVNPRLSNCTVAGVAYSTPLDCALAYARQYAAEKNVPVSLELDAGSYDTKVGFQASPAHLQTVSIRGAGKGMFGGGTTINLVAPLTTAVITYPYLPKAGPKSGYWYNLHLEGFSVDAGGLAPSCFKLYALGVAHLDDLGCKGAAGTGPNSVWVQIGGYPTQYDGGDVPDGFRGIGFQVMVNDFFVYHNGHAQDSRIGATISDGRVTAWPVISSGNFRESFDQALVVKGPNAGTPLCAVMPTGVMAHMVPDSAHPGLFKIGAVTAATPGSGCSGTASIGISDMAAADYGFRIAATDSTFRDLTDDSVGRRAAISDRGSGAATFYSAHAWGVPVAFETWGGDTWNDSEVDTVLKTGFFLHYGSYTHVNHTKFVYLPSPVFGSVADYTFNNGVTDATISDQTCNPLNPNPGYVQFVNTTGGFDLGYGPETPSTKAAGIRRGHLLPLNLTVRNAPPCAALPPIDAGVAVESPRITGTSDDRSLTVAISNRGSTMSRPILLGELAAYDGGQTSGSGVRITVSGGAFGGKTLTDVMTLNNGTKFTYSHRSLGDQAQRASIPVSAWKQPDGSVKIYAQADAHCSLVVTIDMVLNSETHLETAVSQETATGTAVFNSGDAATYAYEAP